MSQELPRIQGPVGGTAQIQYGAGTGDPAQQPPTGDSFEDTLRNEMRVALHDFVETATVANWCADECLGHPGMEECARVCRDVADLAALNAQFMARDSAFGADLAETFAHAAQEAEGICSQYPHDHCRECSATLRRAIDSTWEMLDSFQGLPQGGAMQTPQGGAMQTPQGGAMQAPPGTQY